MMNFSAELKERQEYVNRVLDAFLPAADGRQKTVLETSFVATFGLRKYQVPGQ